MKKIILNSLLLLLFAFSACVQSATAITSVPEKASQTVSINPNEIPENEAEVIKKFRFKNKFQRSPEAQIKSFYKNFSKYSEHNEVEKLKALYSDLFINNDGFDKNIIFKMMTDSADAYKDITNTLDIEKISVDGNYAVVDLHEFAIGSTSKINNNTGDYGLISSDMYYTDYLQKEGSKWKITSTNVKSERVMLKYGEAKNMAVEIVAPRLVPAGSEYNVDVNLSSPDGVMLIGSIVNEQILYPQVQKKDVFRAIKSESLSRVLKSNADAHNEYATATIGITRVSVDPPKVSVGMTGMAFIMTRINVVNVKKNNMKVAENESKTSVK